MLPQEVDWLALWRELALRLRTQFEHDGSPFIHKERAREYDSRSRAKNEQKKDILLGFVIKNVDSGQTVLDIGAGTGRWTISLAKIARQVTAVEPSAAMLDILRDKATATHLNNVECIQATWEEAVVEPHDIVVCAHAVYSSTDLAAFVHKMEKYARQTCYLALRLFASDGIMSELSRAIYGHPHDSPNFIIAYNALYSMGTYTNVLVEDSTYHWTSPDIDAALARAKRHLYLGTNTQYDELIRHTLDRRLAYRNGCYLWPDGMRSALIWWHPAHV